MINYGEEAGKPVLIVDIIDQSRALVDGPNVARKAVAFKRLQLSDIAIKFPRAAGSKIVNKVWKAEGLDAKWNDSEFAKLQKKRAQRAAMTDFDRFKLMLAKKQVIHVFHHLAKSHCLS